MILAYDILKKVHNIIQKTKMNYRTLHVWQIFLTAKGMVCLEQNKKDINRCILLTTAPQNHKSFKSTISLYLRIWYFDRKNQDEIKLSCPLGLSAFIKNICCGTDCRQWQNQDSSGLKDIGAGVWFLQQILVFGEIGPFADKIYEYGIVQFLFHKN